MFRVKAALITSAVVLIEYVSETQTVKETGRGETKENFSTSGRADVTHNLDILGEISTARDTELQ